MKPLNSFQYGLRTVAIIAALLTAVESNAVTIPNTPMGTLQSAPPLVMLIAGKDHKLFYEAYNDASDIDGDGQLDINFNPNIVYYGLFDPHICYTHNDKDDNTGLFIPRSKTSDGKCKKKWSGLWLNYVTTSRMDSLRKVLYGGYREIDSDKQTILRRAYIPADAHSWGKEYTNKSVNGYQISDYTPLSQPRNGKRHFFGNLTDNYTTPCTILNNCSNLPPLLRIRTNVGGNKRIWNWASKERPVLSDKLAGEVEFPDGTEPEKNYTVRVAVCTNGFYNGCKLYPNSIYKPVGLLHDYGENDAMLFGLLTGSYDNHMSGGRLRKVVASFKNEVNTLTGQFTGNAKIINTFNSIRIRGFNQNNSSGEYWKVKPYAASAKIPKEGEFLDWGNPIGEILYEGVRYFSGKKIATSAFNTETKYDEEVGLSSATWDDPFEETSAAKAKWCARSNFLTLSDVDPSFDSNQVPGSKYAVSFPGDVSALSVKNELDTITASEAPVKGFHFIGESDANTNSSASTEKYVTSLGGIRGLAPSEPAKQGSYNSAGVAYFAKHSDLRPDLPKQQSIETFVVALASPLPKIVIPVGSSTVTLIPFAKSVGGRDVNASKGSYQPTNQIVDFYVETFANHNPSINGGRYKAKFIINYEGDEQGGDHDMDAVAEYTVTVNKDNSVSIVVTPTYQAGNTKQSMGYVISGVGAHSGVYLVAQDEPENHNYYLNVPAGKKPNYCDVAEAIAACSTLPSIGDTPATFTFTPSGTGATVLNSPLWYAAKWGGFNDLNSLIPANATPDLQSEWDSDKNGEPDNYFLVQNPSNLSQRLKNIFESIAAKNSSASNVSTNSTNSLTGKFLFQARFDSTRWSGDLIAHEITSSGISAIPTWRAKTKLIDDTSRRLYYRASDLSTKEFLFDNLTATDKLSIGKIASAQKDMMNYLRGDRSKETLDTGNYRKRANTVLGDIVHSSPIYDKTSDVVFVAGNDGMLHAFKASEGVVANSAGSELFGFIPAQSFSQIKDLASPSYIHKFFVDGDVILSGISSETDNKNYLVTTLGRGGKGLFALDVTTPSTFGSANFLWEYTPKGSAAAADDAHLGLMLGRPRFVHMNCPIVSPATMCKQNAVIVGNGVNSSSGNAILYIFLLNKNGSIASVKKLETNAGGDNGLSTPTGFDADSNGTIDYIYAGDLYGNLWKFDVSNTNQALWKLANFGNPFFVAKDSLNNFQPITGPVSIGINTIKNHAHEGKRYVFFGTGSHFQTGDAASTSVQSWYGLIDENASITSRTDLKPRTIKDVGTFSGYPVRVFSEPVADDMVSKKGWYLDFTSPTGERMVTAPLLTKLIVPALFASSIIPDVTDPCASGGKGHLNVMDPFNGGALTVGVVDINDDKKFHSDKLNGYFIGSIDLGMSLLSEPIVVGNGIVIGGSEEDKPVTRIPINLGTKKLGRLSWREIIKD